MRPVHPFIQQRLTGPAPETLDPELGPRWALHPASVLIPTSTLPFQNKCVPYWPEVGSQRVYGPYAVTNCREHDTAEYKLCTLQVSPLDNVRVPMPRDPPGTVLWLGGKG